MEKELTYNGQQGNYHDEEGAIKFQELLYICWGHWYWFLISIIVALILGITYFVTTQPIYTRSASILIKDDNNAQSLSKEFSQFSDMGAYRSMTNLYNEMLTLKSPTYIKDVVKELHLNIEYEKEGTFHPITLYKENLPVSVNFVGIKEDQFVTLKLKLGRNNDVEIFDINTGEKQLVQTIKGKLNSFINSPVGPIVVMPTKAYKGAMKEPITVTRQDIDDVTKMYLSKLKVTLNDEKASVIDLTLDDTSPERAEDILNTLFVVYNQKWLEDINKQAISTSHFIDEELNQIEKELGHVDENISSYKSEHLVPDVQAASSMYMSRSEETNTRLIDLKNQLYMAN